MPGSRFGGGGQISQETRRFREAGYTSPGRAKETPQDYRYFPAPTWSPSRTGFEGLREG